MRGIGSNVLPDFATDHLVDRRQADAVFLSKSLYNGRQKTPDFRVEPEHSALCSKPYRHYIELRELRAPMRRTKVTLCHSVLTPHGFAVQRIVSLRTKEQMRRVTADWVVAPVEHV